MPKCRKTVFLLCFKKDNLFALKDAKKSLLFILVNRVIKTVIKGDVSLKRKGEKIFWTFCILLILQTYLHALNSIVFAIR